MEEADSKHWKALLRTVRYVEQTKNYGLNLEPNLEKIEKNVLKVFSDSDYCVDKETRSSVTGYVIFLNGTPIAWRSKGQKNVTLSTTEAEYVALSEAARKTKFIQKVLKSLNFEVDLPIKMFVDNVGTIFLANNRNASDGTKHVDIRYHFVREMIDIGFIEIVFVPTDENIADIFTKNLDSKKFKNFQMKLNVLPND
jgi:hypothetical protein